MPGMIGLKVIGIIDSCFREKFATPRQPHLAPGSEARLHLRADFIPEQSLKGLEQFSHVWLLFHFHLNTNKRFLSTVHPPRLKGKTIGVFASRSPHRPSPIGLTLARLVKIEGDTLFFSGVDLIDGTPILDLKPYIPGSDYAPGAATGWTQALAARDFDVVFSEAALGDLAGIGKDAEKLKRLVSEVLQHDPRNPRDASQMKSGKILEAYLLDYRVYFQIQGQTAVVEKVERV